MAALRTVSLRFLQRPAPVFAGHAGCRRHLSGGWNLTSSRVPQEAKAGWWLSPSGLLILFAADACTGKTCPVTCDANAELAANDKEMEMLVKLRGVMGRLKVSADLDSEALLKAGRTAYQSAVGPDGRLSQEGLEQMLASSMAQQKRSFWRPRASSENDVTVSEMALILLQLLDADGDGNVTENEFLMGYKLLFAASRAQTPEALVELCWRALDADGNGTVSRDELQVAVRMMARLNAVRTEDKTESFGRMKKTGHRAARTFKRDRSVEDLISYYMEMYDVNKDGNISKDEFCQHSALQENFLLLLSTAEFESLLQVPA